MSIARNHAEIRIRAAILAAETAALCERRWALLCRDPKNIALRRANASVQLEIAAEHRTALAELLLLDGKTHHAMPEMVQ